MIGFVGVLAGAGVTFLGVWWTQTQVERREREKLEQERRKEEQKVAEAELIAARILQEQLAWAEARIEQALKNERYWSARYGLKEDTWLEHREQIAVALDDPEHWSCVRDGFRSVKTLELQASKRRKDDLSRAKAGDWGLKQLRFGLKRVQSAIEILEPVAKDRPRQALSRDPDRDEDEPSINANGDF